MHSFTATGSDGQNPAARLLHCSNGFLYGTTEFGGPGGNGTIYRILPDGSGFETLHGFSGRQPLAGLIETEGGDLVGTSLGGGQATRGTIFRIKPAGDEFEVLHEFSRSNQDAQHPSAALVAAQGGVLYGTARQGGAEGNGAIFKINPDGTGYSVVHSFLRENDANSPFAALVAATDGLLYGTSRSGGEQPGSTGTVFKINPEGTDYTILHSFLGADYDGHHPTSKLVEGRDGLLFGTTTHGATENTGVLFRVRRDGTDYRILHEFSETSPQNGFGDTRVMIATNEKVYVTTSSGGENGAGILFSLHQDGSDYQVLHHFGETEIDARAPMTTLLQGVDGMLYGTASTGGDHELGCIYSLETDGSGFEIIYSFGEGSGTSGPNGDLLEGSDGRLYGIKTGLLGAVYGVNRDGSGYALLHQFPIAGPDGSTPRSRQLFEGGDGALYGTTSKGGAHGEGTVFKIDKDGSNYRDIYSFEKVGNGARRPASLVEDSSGFLYGTSQRGGTGNFGTVFRLRTNGSEYSTIHEFSNEDGGGSAPIAGLLLASDDRFYGTTEFGGTWQNFGTLFRIRVTYPPVAASDLVLRNFQEGAVIPLEQLLYNDLDPQGSSLVLVSVDSSANSGATVNLVDQHVSYAPSVDFNSTDTFTYTVSNEHGDTATATVFIIVNDSAGAPVLISTTTLPDGLLRFVFSGTADQEYLIQRTDSLSFPDWKVQTTISADSEGALIFDVADFETSSERYFRALPAPPHP